MHKCKRCDYPQILHCERPSGHVCTRDRVHHPFEVEEQAE